MRSRVIDVLEFLAAGETPDQILAEYPYLEAEDVAASLLYAARQLDHPVLAACDESVSEVEGAARRSEEPSFHVWIDAQLPPSLAYWLKTEQSVSAVRLESLGLHTARDREIVERAKLAERPVVLITKDEDFRRLLELRGVPHQVV